MLFATNDEISKYVKGPFELMVENNQPRVEKKNNTETFDIQSYVKKEKKTTIPNTQRDRRTEMRVT